MSTETSKPTTSDTRLKKLLPFIVTALLLLAGAFMIYAILVGPSKEPYRTALTQYRNVYNANITFTQSGAAINASNATDEAFEKNIAVVRKAAKSLETENAALGKKEVLQSGEGKELYETFNKKLSEYLEYNEKVIGSIQAIRPAVYNCSSKMTNITIDASGAAALRTCAVELNALKDVPDPDYRQLVESFAESYNNAATAIEKIASLPDPDGADKAQYKVYLAQQEESIDSLNTASTTLAQNLKKHRSEVDITEAAMALDAYLSRKSSIF